MGWLFTNRNIAEDAEDGEARDILLAITGRQATPVIVVGDEVIEGFDRGRLQRVLNLTTS